MLMLCTYIVDALSSGCPQRHTCCCPYRSSRALFFKLATSASIFHKCYLASAIQPLSHVLCAGSFCSSVIRRVWTLSGWRPACVRPSCPACHTPCCSTHFWGRPSADWHLPPRQPRLRLRLRLRLWRREHPSHHQLTRLVLIAKLVRSAFYLRKTTFHDLAGLIFS